MEKDGSSTVQSMVEDKDNSKLETSRNIKLEEKMASDAGSESTGPKEMGKSHHPFWKRHKHSPKFEKDTQPNEDTTETTLNRWHNRRRFHRERMWGRYAEDENTPVEQTRKFRMQMAMFEQFLKEESACGHGDPSKRAAWESVLQKRGVVDLEDNDEARRRRSERWQAYERCSKSRGPAKIGEETLNGVVSSGMQEWVHRQDILQRYQENDDTDGRARREKMWLEFSTKHCGSQHRQSLAERRQEERLAAWANF